MCAHASDTRVNGAENTLSYPTEVMMPIKKIGLNENGNVPVPAFARDVLQTHQTRPACSIRKRACLPAPMLHVSRTARITNNSDTNANSAYSRLG
jgi:hypothetical protein